jgi:hypothetical protein
LGESNLPRSADDLRVENIGLLFTVLEGTSPDLAVGVPVVEVASNKFGCTFSIVII